ncbi:MAG: PaaI family thioesterase [Myxococcota bacterium]
MPEYSSQTPPRSATGGLIPFVDRSGLVLEEARRGYVRMRMPLEGNVNHVGMMYAGALFTLAEVPGGALFVSSFDAKQFYPIVKSLDIQFRRPAKSDITVEVSLTDARIEEIAAAAEANGKADYDWECELVDAEGTVVARTTNRYQMRRIGT